MIIVHASAAPSAAELLRRLGLLGSLLFSADLLDLAFAHGRSHRLPAGRKIRRRKGRKLTVDLDKQLLGLAARIRDHPAYPPDALAIRRDVVR